MKAIRTFNAFHLGDNVIHVNFLRRLASAHPGLPIEHKTHKQYHRELLSLTTDLPQITFTELTERPLGYIDAWRGSNGFWYSHPRKDNFAAFHIEHFQFMAERMGLPSPINKAEDMLFEAPILNPENIVTKPVDILLVNSAPQSNQWPQYNPDTFSTLHAQLINRGYEVLTTEECRLAGWTVAQIGAVGATAKYIIGTANGPVWPTFNIWASPVKWILFLGSSERVNIHPRTVCTPHIMEALEYL